MRRSMGLLTTHVKGMQMQTSFIQENKPPIGVFFIGNSKDERQYHYQKL